MPDRRHVLTPDALVMMDAIARTGSFAAAARELGKVPSALTYNVRQLEEALDVLLFDRSSRQAQPTAAGLELLHEGRRLLQEMEAVANRVKRVASGWEATLSISVEDILSTSTMFDLVEAFCHLRPEPGGSQGPATRLRLRSDVLAGTWEALISGQVDLAIGVAGEHPNPGGVELRPLGEVPFGKQSWYGPQSGLWQSVRLERRDAAHLTCLRLRPDLATGRIDVGVDFARVPDAHVEVEVTVADPEGRMVAATGTSR